MSGQPCPAAVLMDYENVYYFLKNSTTDRRDVVDLTIQMIRGLRKYLLDTYNEQVISLDAYADFERIKESPMGDLYLLGVEAHNVLGTEHKNAADMRLCIDAMEILYTRQSIQSFILVAGDRDYIPVIQHLKKNGRLVRVAGFRGSVSGDLLLSLGEEYFIDAKQFLPDVELPSFVRAGVNTASAGAATSTTAVVAGAGAGIKPQPGTAKPAMPVFSAPKQWYEPEVEEDLTENQKFALHLLLKYFGSKPEVYMVPYLHRLRNEMPQLTEWDRKRLIMELNARGAIKVEKRSGDEHDYSVIIINWNHADVQTNY